MAEDSSRPRPPILKRFANLDIDGVDAPPRVRPPQKAEGKRGGGLVESAPTVQARGSSSPSTSTRGAPSAPAQRPSDALAERSARTPSARRDESGPPSPLRRPSSWASRPIPATDSDIDRLRELSADLSDNARASRQSATPEARRSQRAAELRAARPPDPRLTRPLTPEEIRAQQAERVRREVDRIRFDLRPITAEDLDLDLPDELTTGGVVAVEVDLFRGRRGSRGQERRATLEPEPPPWDLPRSPPAGTPGARFVSPAPSVNAYSDSRNVREQDPSLIELTPMAARQIQLMAWEAGVPGSPLRILTTQTPGLGHPEIDFAFDENVEPEDIVVDALGVTVVIDPQSLTWVRGRRITWHDVPGSEGFLLR